MQKILGVKGQEFLESRGIDIETSVRFGVYTAKRVGHETLPSPTGDIISFPYIENGAVVNEKYRTLDKRFWQWQSPRSTFYNAGALDDPGLAAGMLPLIITEGEIDCLTAIQCGFPLSVSVPDGAPAKPSSELLTVTAEPESKFAYCWNNQEKLSKVKRFVLAVDSDEPGRILAGELMRRFGAGRCYTVQYPKGCKDLNDVLIQHGPEKVASVLNGAAEWPVNGLYRLSDFSELPDIETYSTGWELLDTHLKMWPGELMVITGIPGHGKTSFALNLLTNVGKMHGWRAAIFSPEMPVVPFMRNRLLNLHGGDKLAALSFVEDRFSFIGSNPGNDKDSEVFTLDWLLEMAETAIWRFGIKVLLIDPWNELEHAKRRDESSTEYIGRSIVSLKRFAARHGVAVIIIAHPTKDVARDGKSRPLSLYDIAESAHFYNKCDHGLIIDCPDSFMRETTIRIAKVRLDGTGEKGAIRMKFDRETGQYRPLIDG